MQCLRGCSEELSPFLGAGGSAGRLLQRRETLPPSMLPSWETGTWQQETAKKPSAR